MGAEAHSLTAETQNAIRHDDPHQCPRDPEADGLEAREEQHVLAGASLGNCCWHTEPCLYNLPHLGLGGEAHQMFRKPFSSFFIKHNKVLWSNANVHVCSKRVLLVFKGCYILYDDT